MSTNSSITICEPMIVNGERVGELYRSVYCHWDGYTSYNGTMLLEHYATAERVNELISHGFLSVLHERIAPNDGEEHSFDKPLPDVCVFYHRDRGEAWRDCAPYVTMSEKELFELNGREYNYLFQDGRWYWCTYKDVGEDGRRLWKELTEEDCRMQR